MTSFEVMLAQNVAKNGRLFSAMIFVANMVAFHQGYGRHHWYIALIVAASVGCAYIAEGMPLPQVGRAAHWLALATGVIAFVLSILAR